MKICRLLFCAFILQFYAFYPAAAQKNDTLVGVIDDAFDVNPLGTYNHIIPLNIPPGVNGLVPSLNLVYDSRQGMSELGYGWSLSGLSTITRSGNNFAQHGRVNGIRFNAKDAFLLDGQFLSCVEKVNGSANSVYRTENESFAIIRAIGAIPYSQASPEYFVVKYPGGLTYYYGLSTQSRQAVSPHPGKTEVLEWHISKIEDNYNNYIEFEYSLQSGNTIRVESISYTGNTKAGLRPASKILFNYEDGAAKVKANVSFLAGSSFEKPDRLSSIQMQTNGRNTRCYFFEFDPGTHQHLVQIKECSDVMGKSCIPATTIQWNRDSALQYAGAETINYPEALGANTFLKDLNADGEKEFIKVSNEKVGGKDSVSLHIYARKGSVFALQKSVRIAGGPFFNVNDILFPDLNGDHLADIVSATLVFVNKSTLSDFHFMMDTCFPCNGALFNPYRERKVVDMNGDGRDEIMINASLSVNYRFEFYGLNDQHKFTQLGSLAYSLPNVVRQLEGDFIASGKTGLLPLMKVSNMLAGPLFYADNTWPGNFNIEADTMTYVLPAVFTEAHVANMKFIDINGDGLSDLTIQMPYQPLQIWLFNGRNFTTATAIQPLPALPPATRTSFGYFTSTTFLQYLVARADNDVQVYDIIVTGAGSVDFVKSATPFKDVAGLKLFTDWDKVSFEDVNWDGMPDLIKRGASETRYVALTAHNNTVKLVKDGFGNVVTIQYTGLGDSAAYSCDFTPLRSNYFHYRGSFPIVRSISYSNGVLTDGEGLNTVQYRYKNLIAEKTGRGLAGFQTVTKRQKETAIELVHEYAYEFPLTGKLLNETRKQNNIPYFQQENTWSFQLYRKGSEYDEQADSSVTAKLLPVEATLLKNKFLQSKASDSRTALQLLTAFPDNIDYNVIKNDSSAITTAGAQRSAGVVLKSIRQFSLSQLTYCPLLSSSRISKYELDGQLISRVTVQNQFNRYGNTTRCDIDFGEGTVSTTEKTFVHFNANTTPDGTYIIGLPVTEVTYVRNQKINQQTAKRTIDCEYSKTTGALVKKIRQKADPQLRQLVEWKYDETGNVVLKKSYRDAGKPVVETFTYSEDRRFATGFTNAIGFVTTREYDDYTGRKLSETDANGFSMRFQFDKAGNLVKEIFPDGNFASYRYRLNDGDLHDKDKIAYWVATQSGKEQATIRCFDLKGRCAVSTFPLVDAEEDETGSRAKVAVKGQSYDRQGNLKNVIKPCYAYQQIEGDKVDIEEDTKQKKLSTVYEYDMLGRVTKVMNPDQSYSTIVYQANSKTETSFNGSKKTIIYDAKGQVIEIRDAAGHSLKYQYDLWGNLSKIVQPTGTIDISYDLIGRKTRVKDPNAGIIEYTYDEFDRLLTETTNGKRTIRLEYDALSRILRKITPEGVIEWSYDQSVKGKVDRIRDSNGNITTYGYDHLGRPVQQIQIINGVTYTYTFGYDSLSRVISKTYPSGLTVLSLYKNNARVGIKVQLPGSTVKEIWQADAISATGQLLHSRAGNGVVTTYSYDERNDLLNGIKAVSTGRNTPVTVQHLAYRFDGDYRITSKADSVFNIAEAYGYDVVGRLTQHSMHRNNTGSTWQFEYNLSGNLQQKGGTGVYQYDPAANQRVRYIYNNGNKTHEFSYDDYGNLIADKAKQLSLDYTYFNKPRHIETPVTQYDIGYGWDQSATNTVLKKDQHISRESVHPSADFEIIRSNGNTSRIHYLSGGGGLVAVVTITDSGSGSFTNIAYVHKDHLGSVYALTDSVGNPSIAYYYSPFGERQVLPSYKYNDTTSSIAKGYTGHEHLEAFGLLNANGRYYFPETGRFLSPDPFVEDPATLQSFNRYSYVLNNPVNNADPSGFWSIRKPFNFKKETRALNRGIKNIGRELGQATDKVSRFHQDIYNEGDRFLDKYGKQVVIIAAAATITYFTCGAGTAAFWGAVGKGALVGAGISGGMTAAQGGNFKEVMNASLNGAMNGAAGAAMFYSIGSGFEKLGKEGLNPELGFAGKTVAHGVGGGISSEISGGNFQQGFIETSIVHGLSPVNESLFGLHPDHKFARIAFSGSVGGIAAYASGGNVLSGVTTGSFSRWFNCEAHLPPTDNPLYQFLDPAYEAWKCDQKVINPGFRNSNLEFERGGGAMEWGDALFPIYEQWRMKDARKQESVPQQMKVH
ncbi:RHS repeat-associated protein [Filimonas zeae]|uniref:Teneurin-like YD-shell domain-containing protein n=1 Tax=Filimonas zeae TaxID=1737353 RepID=A0A917IVH4_9BACT|nr:RHS repeat-associated core domain-containing protein [Filimonas zeae]MDR6338954.1 RHS repeat-associated protein [Filimonas zeae]GGH65795.1 hypothetical protein GCM10011379_19320 [Filimonas zeae]